MVSFAPKRFVRFPCLLSCLVAALSAGVRAQEPATTSSPGKPASLLTLTRNRLLEEALYSVPRRLASGIAESGAVSVNDRWERKESAKWFIEQQRYGADLIQAGIVRGEDSLIRQGLRVLDWGFDRQGPDGSFPGTGDPFHSVSFFVEAAARGLLLLREQDAAGYAEVLRTRIPRVAAAAHWLTRPEVVAVGRTHNAPYTHRRWLLAAALGQTAALTGDEALATAAGEYAREGLALQREDGVNPERGGADVSYQAVGLLLAARYHTVCPDPTLRQKIRRMIKKGLQWEATKIEKSGKINMEGSSRTGVETGRSGGLKSADYKAVVQAFVLGGAITDTPSCLEDARRIARARDWIRTGKR
ncbi:MAG: hypothetical protein SFU56_04520 [Capsulimonadales bacterium]|nr:hypothetical protein [Capsulimonadales bacterium]